MMLMQRSQVRKCFIKSKTEAYIQRKVGIRLENWIKNKKGRSTSSEVLRISWCQKALVI